VSGEPGIGKTTLVRAFLDSISADRAVRVGHGQCVEQYGAGEPYMPVLEALTRLCREPHGEQLLEILHRMAPAWLAQMPSLVSADDRLRLQALAQGTSPQRMLREMAEALEVMASDQPLVVLLEDLRWSDPVDARTDRDHCATYRTGAIIDTRDLPAGRDARQRPSAAHDERGTRTPSTLYRA